MTLLEYIFTPNHFSTYNDALVIEKTDINDNYPDGGIAFMNTVKIMLRQMLWH